jgi:prevent-host-death family protein
MNRVTLTYAKAHLSELIDQVLEGHSIDVTRHGKPVARLTTIEPPRKQIDAAALRSLTSTMSPASESAAEFVRSMRDDDRY